MNKLGASTLKKFKNYLKLKNYCEKTIKCYSDCLNRFLQFQKKSGMILSYDDCTNFFSTFEFSSYQQQNQYISSLKIFYENILKKKYIKIDFQRPRNEKHLPQIIDSEDLLNSISKIKNLKQQRKYYTIIANN